MSERQAPPRCIDSPDPTTLAARFEAWWQTSPRRNQNLIGPSDKRTLAFDAFEAGAFTSSGDAVREGHPRQARRGGRMSKAAEPGEPE